MTTVNIYDMADTWNDGGTTFTAIKMDVTDTASASASLLMDLQVGSASKFSVDKDGAIDITGVSYASGLNVSPSGDTLYIKAGGGNQWGVTGAGALNSIGTSQYIGFNGVGVPDLILSRKAAANLRLGAADAGTVIAQTLSVQGGSGTNIAGQDFTIQGSQSTGDQPGGSILFQVSPAGSAGSGQNGFQTALTIGSDKILVAATPPSLNVPFVGIATDFGLGASASFLTAIYGGTARALMGVDDGAATVKVQDSGFFGWSSTSTVNATYDVALWRDAANTLALRNGANAQTFRVYNTYTGSADEWLEMSWTSNAAYLTTGVNGGSARSLTVRTGGSQALFLGSNGTNRWRVESNGHFLAHLDDTYDIGASGATRPRTVYVADNVVTGATDFIHETSVALADGAGANAATLTNAPAAGNPTKWIAINDNGTTRYIPAW